MVGSKEGVFCEPASAASIAGVLKLRKQNKLTEGSTIVCVLTGHGLKDPDNAILYGEKPQFVKCDAKEIAKLLGY